MSSKSEVPHYHIAHPTFVMFTYDSYTLERIVTDVQSLLTAIKNGDTPLIPKLLYVKMLGIYENGVMQFYGEDDEDITHEFAISVNWRENQEARPALVPVKIRDQEGMVYVGRNTTYERIIDLAWKAFLVEGKDMPKGWYNMLYIDSPSAH